VAAGEERSQEAGLDVAVLMRGAIGALGEIDQDRLEGREVVAREPAERGRQQSQRRTLWRRAASEQRRAFRSLRERSRSA
jgi:hypothetical protein